MGALDPLDDSEPLSVLPDDPEPPSEEPEPPSASPAEPGPPSEVPEPPSGEPEPPSGAPSRGPAPFAGPKVPARGESAGGEAPAPEGAPSIELPAMAEVERDEALRTLTGRLELEHPRLDARPLPPRAAVRPRRRAAAEHLAFAEDGLFVRERVLAVDAVAAEERPGGGAARARAVSRPPRCMATSTSPAASRHSLVRGTPASPAANPRAALIGNAHRTMHRAFKGHRIRAGPLFARSPPRAVLLQGVSLPRLRSRTLRPTTVDPSRTSMRHMGRQKGEQEPALLREAACSAPSLVLLRGWRHNQKSTTDWVYYDQIMDDLP